MTAQDWTKDDIEYGIDGGYLGIYDGVIVWVLKDGRYINRFAGDGGRREARIDEYIKQLQDEADTGQLFDDSLEVAR